MKPIAVLCSLIFGKLVLKFILRNKSALQEFNSYVLEKNHTEKTTRFN